MQTRGSAEAVPSEARGRVGRRETDARVDEMMNDARRIVDPDRSTRILRLIRMEIQRGMKRHRGLDHRARLARRARLRNGDAACGRAR